MDLRMLGMMLLSGVISVLGMIVGSLLAGGHAVALLQLLFPFIIVMHSVMYLYGVLGVVITIASGFVFTSDQNGRKKVFFALVCVVTWMCITFSLDKAYLK